MVSLHFCDMNKVVCHHLRPSKDYLPVLLGLAQQGSVLRHKVQFTWSNQEDNAEANTLLLPRSYGNGYAPRVSEESRHATVDVFLKAAG
ncbi:Endosomal targeting BRO1-like domain-containing protein [Zea mays]|uniref:Endosomal targeting BRO1-like domain-containing protein n=1 Tax=Zea mays TaxID=4577 RepID=A0A1D6G2V7_MAIZE|nr:Endosomal targeting BRO1-like domain-containing protein [Zea mays]